MRVELPPEIQPVFDGVRARRDEIQNNQRYTTAAKDELIREAERQARCQFDTAFEKLKAARQKELDREEGQARAQLRNDAPNFDMLASDGQRIATLVKTMHEGNKLKWWADIQLGLIRMTADSSEVKRIA